VVTKFCWSVGSDPGAFQGQAFGNLRDSHRRPDLSVETIHHCLRRASRNQYAITLGRFEPRKTGLGNSRDIGRSLEARKTGDRKGSPAPSFDMLN